MPSLSTARVFYERVIAGGTPFLESLVVEQTPETEWLDFKSADQLAPETIKATWSRALCGFANNQGGVLIWGIDARFDPISKVDAACSVVPVQDPRALRSRISQLHPTATEPPLAGVESKEFFLSSDSGPGFVVSYIPESDIKPHRAELMPGNPYLMRIGDSFKPISVSVLRSLFFPRTNSRLEVEVSSRWNPWAHDENAPNRNPPTEIEIKHRLVIRNTGTASAKDVFVLLVVDTRVMSIETSHARRATDYGIGIELPHPIHPSTSEVIGTLTHKEKIVTQTSSRGRELVPAFSPVEIGFHLSATDMLMHRVTARLTEWDVETRRTIRAVEFSEAKQFS